MSREACEVVAATEVVLSAMAEKSLALVRTRLWVWERRKRDEWIRSQRVFWWIQLRPEGLGPIRMMSKGICETLEMVKCGGWSEVGRGYGGELPRLGA